MENKKLQQRWSHTNRTDLVIFPSSNWFFMQTISWCFSSWFCYFRVSMATTAECRAWIINLKLLSSSFHFWQYQIKSLPYKIHEVFARTKILYSITMIFKISPKNRHRRDFCKFFRTSWPVYQETRINHRTSNTMNILFQTTEKYKETFICTYLLFLIKKIEHIQNSK